MRAPAQPDKREEERRYGARGQAVSSTKRVYTERERVRRVAQPNGASLTRVVSESQVASSICRGSERSGRLDRGGARGATHPLLPRHRALLAQDVVDDDDEPPPGRRELEPRVDDVGEDLVELLGCSSDRVSESLRLERGRWTSWRTGINLGDRRRPGRERREEGGLLRPGKRRRERQLDAVDDVDVRLGKALDDRRGRAARGARVRAERGRRGTCAGRTCRASASSLSSPGGQTAGTCGRRRRGPTSRSARTRRRDGAP